MGRKYIILPVLLILVPIIDCFTMALYDKCTVVMERKAIIVMDETCNASSANYRTVFHC